MRYRKIDPRIWNDEKFRTLSDDGKLAFLFLLTHPHMTALGAMRGTFPGLAAELGWTTKRFESALAGSLSQGIVEACEKASWIAIPNFLRYNEPEGPNSVSKAWVAALDLLPECPEKSRLMQRCGAYLEGQTNAFKHAMGHAIWDAIGYAKSDAIVDAKSNPCHIQEQEQEQEPEPEEEKRAAPPSAATADRPKRKGQLSDGEFIAALKMNSAYGQLDIDLELGKLDAWLLTPRGRGKKKTRQRIVTWLNKAADDQREVKTSPSRTLRICIWKLTNGDARHPKLCNKRVSMANGIESSHCEEHLAQYLDERRRIDAQLNRVTA